MNTFCKTMIFILFLLILSGTTFAQTDCYTIDRSRTEWTKDTSEVSVEPLLEDSFYVKCYPNPFSNSILFVYRLTKPAFVLLKVYDIFGNKISTLIDKWQEAGEYSSVFKAENSSKQFPAGIYIYKIQAGNYVKTDKLILMK